MAVVPVDLPPEHPPQPAMVTEHILAQERLQQRGAVLTGEALADWSLLIPDQRSAAVSGLPGTLVVLDGLRLAPAPDGRADLSLLPLAWLDGATLTAAPSAVSHGAGSLAGTVNLALAPQDSQTRLWALAGAQSGRGIAGLDMRVGHDLGWLSGGFTQGGAVPTAAGLAATRQSRWHVGTSFAHRLGTARLSGRALFAGRDDAGRRADRHDLSLKLTGDGDWAWAIDVAHGGQVNQSAPGGRESSRMELLSAGVRHTTGLISPWAAQAAQVAFGGEIRQLRFSGRRVVSRELYGQARLPLLQDRPAAESVELELGWRQAWIAGRAEPLWKTQARWEFFPGLALRGQLARSVDDLAMISGTSRSVGLVAVPAFVPGLALALDWRRQTAGPARIAAVDVSASLRHGVGDQFQLVVNAMATHHQQARWTAVPVARFAGLLRVGIEHSAWTVAGALRHRSGVAGQPARSAVDFSVDHRLSSKLRVIASVTNAGGAGGPPVGRQALLQVIAGF